MNLAVFALLSLNMSATTVLAMVLLVAVSVPSEDYRVTTYYLILTEVSDLS